MPTTNLLPHNLSFNDHFANIVKITQTALKLCCNTIPIIVLEYYGKKVNQSYAGYGIGNDRIMQYIFGTTDIRQASVFALFNQQTGDWVPKQ